MPRNAAGHVLHFRQPVAEGPACVVLVERSSVVGLESSGWSGGLSGDPSHCRKAAGGLLSSTALLCCPFLFAGWPSPPSSVGGVGFGTPPQPRPCVSLMGAISSHLAVAAAHSVGSLGVLGHPGGIWQRSDSMCHPCFHLPSLRESSAAEVGLRERP